MATEVARLVGSIRIEGASAATAQLGAVDRGFRATGRSAQVAGAQMSRASAAGSAAWEKQKQSLAAVGRMAKLAAVATGGLGVAGLAYGMKLNAQWESNEKSFGTLLGSMSKGKKLMEDLRQVSSKSYLRLTDFQEASKLMLGMGVSAKRIVPIMSSVNAAVSAVGGNRETLNRVTLALGQMQAKGKASAEEMRQLAEAGLPINKILQKELHLSAEQVANIGNEGVKSGAVLKAVSEAWQRKYGPGLNESMKTGTAQFEMLKKNAEGFLRVATHGIYEVLSRKVLPAANREFEKFTAIMNNPKLTDSQKWQRIGEQFDRLAGKAGRWLEKAIPVMTEAATKLANKLVPAGVAMGGKLAAGLAKGFLGSNTLTKLVVGGFLFSKMGGFAAMNAAGMGIGTRIMGGISKAMSAGLATAQVGSALGANSFSAAAGGMGVAGRSLAMSLMGGLARAIPIAGALYAVTDVIGRFVEGGSKAGLTRAGATAGGALVGGLIGMLAGPGGAMIGAGIGAALGGPIESAFRSLFGGDKTTAIQAWGNKVKWADSVIAKSAEVRQGISGRLAAFDRMEANAKTRSAQAANNVAAADRNLIAARQQYGPGSVQAQRAELALAQAKERSNRATARANRLGQLSGPIREAAKTSYRSALAVQKQAVDVASREVKKSREAYYAARNRGAGQAELAKKADRWLGAEKRLMKVQGSSARLLGRISRDLGPKVAATMNKQADAALRNLKRQNALRRSFGQLPEPVKKTTSAVERFGVVVPRKLKLTSDNTARYSRTVVTKMGRARRATTSTVVPTLSSLSTITASFKQNKAAILSGGDAEARRRGGVIGYRSGGDVTPVAVSPGEEIHWRGRAFTVPGRAEPRDSVLMNAPVGASVVTFDGQRRMAEGMSLASAVRSQKPHFGVGAPQFRRGGTIPRFEVGGNIPRPKIVGGTKNSRRLANLSISELREFAVSTLKKLDPIGGGNIVEIGKALQRLGYEVGEHPAFGGVQPVHAQGSYHDSGRAIDVNDDANPRGGSEGASLDWLYSKLKKKPHVELLWRVKDHFDHLHFAMRSGGKVPEMRDGGTVPGHRRGRKVTPRSMRRKAGRRNRAPWIRKKYRHINANQAYTLAVYGGIPNPRWASQVMWGESSGNPRTVGHDEGGTLGLGLWQITTGFNDHIIRRYGGRNAMFDPVTNARAARDVYRERQQMGVSGESGWYGRLGPAGHFLPGFYNEIMWSPQQRKFAARQSRRRRRSVSGLWKRIRKANRRGYRAGGTVRAFQGGGTVPRRVPRWVKRQAGLSRGFADKAMFWAKRDPSKSLFWRNKSLRAQKRAGRLLRRWSKNRRKVIRYQERQKNNRPGGGNGGGGNGGGGNFQVPVPMAGSAGQLPPDIQRMLKAKYLTGDQKRSILDMAVGRAEDTDTIEDDRTALGAVMRFEGGRLRTATGRFKWSSKRIRGMRFGKGLGGVSGKRVTAGTIKVARKQVGRINKTLGRMKPKGKKGRWTRAQLRQRNRLKRIKKRITARIGEFDRLTGVQEGALSQITDSESSIREADRAIKDLSEKEKETGSSDLAEEIKALREEIAKQNAMQARAEGIDYTTLRRAMTDMLSGDLAGRADPPRRLGFSPAVNF